MHIIRVRMGTVATALLAATALAGCTDDNGDPFNPGQNGQLPGSTTSSAGQPNVPTVANPLNADPFLDRPCDLVDNKTVAEIGDMKPPEPDVDSERAKRLTGPICDWYAKDPSAGRGISLAIHTVHRDKAGEGLKGIGGIYEGKKNGLFDYLEPVEIPGHPGYPAVFAGSQSDKEAGECPLFFGVADDLAIVVRVSDQRDSPQDTCPPTLQVAASVLQTLKTGS
jgi:hypothetical protein